MKQVVLALIAVVALSACDGDGGDADGSTTTLPGPCAMSTDQLVGQPGLEVVAGDQSIKASLNYATYRYCRGHESEGLEATHSDGFLLTLEDRVVTAEPGTLVEVRGPGYPGGVLQSSATIEAAPDEASSDPVWALRLPESDGDHEIQLSLRWSGGEAEYAFIARIGTATIGPVRLQTARHGVQAVTDDGQTSYFHFHQPVQAYGDGAGGLVYQSMDQQRWANNLDIEWLRLGAVLPQVAVAAGDDSLALQGVDDGRVLSIRVTLDDSNGINPGDRSVVITNPSSGQTTELLNIPTNDDHGIGRASLSGNRVVVSHRSLECTWLSFLDTSGVPFDEPGNPKPESSACEGPFVTGAVFLDDGRLAFVETERTLERSFEVGGSPAHVMPFDGGPNQTVVIWDLAGGETVERVAIEPPGRVVQWLEPAGSGVAVSLGTIGEGFEDASRPHAYLLDRAPAVGDLGSDLPGFVYGPDPVQTLLIADDTWSAIDSGFISVATEVSRHGLCSAAMEGEGIPPPSGVTGLGVDVPVTLYELTPEAEATVEAIIAAARSCDYSALASLAVHDRPSPAYFSGPAFDELADHWRALEAAGEMPLGMLVALLQHPPTGPNPFFWDTNRGDTMWTKATVSITPDGDWVGFQEP